MANIRVELRYVYLDSSFIYTGSKNHCTKLANFKTALTDNVLFIVEYNKELFSFEIFQQLVNSQSHARISLHSYTWWQPITNYIFVISSKSCYLFYFLFYGTLKISRQSIYEIRKYNTENRNVIIVLSRI